MNESLKSIHGLLQKAGSAIPNDPDLWKENLSYSKTFRRDDFLLLLDIAVRLHTHVAELEGWKESAMEAMGHIKEVIWIPQSLGSFFSLLASLSAPLPC